MSSLLTNESPLQISPGLAVSIGLNEAIVLQQVHYWLMSKNNKNFFDNRHWVWNTYAKWQEQFPFWSEVTIRRIINHLEKMGILLSTYGDGFQKVKFYSIDYNRLQVFISNIPQKYLKKSPLPHEHSDHIDQINLIAPNDQHDQSDTINVIAQNDQTDPADMINLISQNDQPDRINSINTIVSYIDTEITPEITLPPPLTPPLEATKNEEEDFFQKMISLWNDSIQGLLHEKSKIVLNDKRRKTLRAFKTNILDAYGLSWEDYCGKIADNGFLMGKSNLGFKVSFDWALHADKAEKIIEGGFFDKNAPKAKKEKEEFERNNIPWSEIEAQLVKNNANAPYGEDWVETCRLLHPVLGGGTLQSYFLDATFLELTASSAVVQVGMDYLVNRMESDYEGQVLRAVQKRHPGVRRVEFRKVVKGRKR